MIQKDLVEYHINKALQNPDQTDPDCIKIKE